MALFLVALQLLTGKNSSMQRQAYQIDADYHQFYLWDEDANPDVPTDWDDTDVQRRLKIAPNLVIVCPARDTVVPVMVIVNDEEIFYDPVDWDHIVECSVDLPSGKLQVHECTGDSVGRFRLTPGTYQVLVLYAELTTISDDGLDGDDHYTVVLWPGSPRELKVIKQYDDPPNGTGTSADH